MIGAVSTGVLTGTIVAAGTWAKGNDLQPHLIVAGAFLGVALVVFENVNAELAGKIGLLILMGALLSYGVPIAQAVGVSNASGTKPPKKKKGGN